MPIYEYKCQECGKVFDILQKLNSDPVETCINCGGSVEKLISASSFQFKGSGWYVTDYKKKDSDKQTASSEKGSSKDLNTKGKDKQKNVA